MGTESEMRPATLESGDDSAKHERIEKLLDRVKKQMAVLKKSVRRTMDDAWELGDALVAVKAVLVHGRWGPWLESVDLHPRLAQRCMALRRRCPEKRQMSDFRSIDAAIRAVATEQVIDAEFQVEHAAADGVGSVPDTRPEATSGSESKGPPEPFSSSDSATSGATPSDPDGTGVTDEGSTTIADASGGSNALDSSAASRSKGSGARLSARPSAVPSSANTGGGQLAVEGVQAGGTAGPQTDDDATSDVRGLVQSLGGVAAGCEVFENEPAAAVQLRPHLGPMLQSFRVLASALVGCLEGGGDDDGLGTDLPEELVPTLEKLIAVASRRERKGSRS